jgi:hypothetical protein
MIAIVLAQVSTKIMVVWSKIHLELVMVDAIPKTFMTIIRMCVIGMVVIAVKQLVRIVIIPVELLV